MAQTLRGRLAKLAGSEPQQPSALSLKIPNPNSWGLAQLCERTHDLLTPAPLLAIDVETSALPRYTLLRDVLYQCAQAAIEVSEEISATYGKKPYFICVSSKGLICAAV